MPVRARENHVYTITANRYGEEEKEGETLTFIGQSEICAPNGDILRRASQNETGIGEVRFDPLSARDRHINEYNDVLRDRRPSSYVTD
jgi:predicted amidohydrolase